MKPGRMKLSALMAVTLVLGMALKGTPANSLVGISTRFVDVTIEFMQVGRSYNLRELRRVPYAVTNKGNTPMDIVVDVLAPRSYELVESYEPIPDPSWIKIVPNKFRVEPLKTGYAEMILEVPNDPKHVGKHYQARIWAHTESSDLIAAGIESRLKFSLGAGPATLKKKKKEMAMMTLDFDVTPRALYVDGVPLGKRVSLKKLAKRVLKVTNRAETPLKMKFVSIPWDLKFPLSGEFKPAPEPGWMTFPEKEYKIKSDRIVDIEPFVEIPDAPENYGKQFAFLVKAELIMGVELEVFNTIYVSTAEKAE